MTKSLVEQQTTMAGMSKDLLKSQRDRIQLKNQLPNEHQHNIDMYGQMSEATGYKQRHNEPWRALLDGMFKGMAMGEKSEMSKKAKENYDTLEKGTAFIMDNLRAGQQMLADLNKKEQIKETISGYVSPIYTAMMAGADRQKIDNMGRPSFVALQDQGIIPQGAVYLTIDTQSKTLIYNKEDGSKGYTDLIPYVNQETMDMNKQRIEQMGMDARMMSAEASQVNAQAHMMSAHTGQVNAHTAQERWASEQRQQDELFPLKKEKMQQEINNLTKTPAENPYNSIPISTLGGRGMTPFMSTINAEIGLAKEVEPALKLLNDAEQLVNSEDYKKATGSGEIKGLNAALHGLFGSSRLPEDVRLKYERLEKDSSRVAEAFIKAKGGNISDSERETIKKGLFKPTNLDKTNQYNIRSVREELIRASLRGNFASDQLRQGFIATSESFDKYLAENPNLIEETKKKFGYQDTTKQESPTPVIDVSKFSPEQLQARKQQLMSKK